MVGVIAINLMRDVFLNDIKGKVKLICDETIGFMFSSKTSIAF